MSIDLTLLGNDFLPNYNILSGLSGSLVTDFDDLLKVTSSELFAKGHIMFPSAMYSINKKSSVAFSWGTRAIAHMTTSEVAIKQILRNIVDEGLADREFSNEFVRTNIYALTEFNFSYAMVLYQSGNHTLKAGATGKILQGLAEMTIDVSSLNFKIAGDSALTYLNLTANYRYNDKVDDFVSGEGLELLGSRGFGFDLGISYEFKDKQSSTSVYPGYKFKAGISAVDLGSIRFQASEERDITASVTDLSLSRFTNIPSVEALGDTLDDIFDLSDSDDPGSYRIKLPARLSFLFDYNFGKNFFLNFYQSIIFNRLNPSQANFENAYHATVTPRYEDKSYGVYLPLQYGTNIQFNAGLSLRWKAFILGSGNIFSRWFYDKDERISDIYLIVKIPFLDKEYRTVGQRIKKRKANKAGESDG